MISKISELDEIEDRNLSLVSDAQVSPQDAKVQTIAHSQIETDLGSSKGLPNLAFEIMKLGAAKEAQIHAKINGHLEEGQNLRRKIHNLLDLSAALTKMPSDAKELSPGAKEIIEKLKKEGIDLKLDGAISKEKIVELKSEIGGRIEQLRSEVNILLSTKVNHLVQVVLPSILDMMKKVALDNKEAISRINERMSRS